MIDTDHLYMIGGGSMMIIRSRFIAVAFLLTFAADQISPGQKVNGSK